MPESSSSPTFLRATMPQVQSPDTGEGSGCGRFRVYLATQCAVLKSKADMQKGGQVSPDDGRHACADVRADRGTGERRRRGRRGSTRAVHR
jgi:hypothetical protein